ncbi:MAG: hypothetical protein WCR97_05100 [Bacilli bacterium]
MILIFGSSKDDILYFDAKTRKKKYEHFYKDATLITGVLAGQEVCIAYGINTNYLSSTFLTTIIDRYQSIVVVINVGMARAYTKDLKPQDLFISESICLGDVNLTNNSRVKLCEIPNVPQFMLSDIYLTGICHTMADQLNIKNIKFGTLISSNNYYEKKEELSSIGYEGELLGINKKIALDCEAGGMAIVCQWFDIPFISIKVIQYEIGKETYSRDNLIGALGQYSNIGKLVCAIISEICRNETTTL